MIVFHGSEHIVEKPVFRGGKKSNDYGYGFYTTESLDLAKECAYCVSQWPLLRP